MVSCNFLYGENIEKLAFFGNFFALFPMFLTWGAKKLRAMVFHIIIQKQLPLIEWVEGGGGGYGGHFEVHTYIVLTLQNVPPSSCRWSISATHLLLLPLFSLVLLFGTSVLSLIFLRFLICKLIDRIQNIHIRLQRK